MFLLGIDDQSGLLEGEVSGRLLKKHLVVRFVAVSTAIEDAKEGFESGNEAQEL